MKNLSADSKKVLEVIENFNGNWEPCYVNDIVDYAGLTKSQIKGHITDLRSKGYITPHDPDCGELHLTD